MINVLIRTKSRKIRITYFATKKYNIETWYQPSKLVVEMFSKNIEEYYIKMFLGELFFFWIHSSCIITSKKLCFSNLYNINMSRNIFQRKILFPKFWHFETNYFSSILPAFLYIYKLCSVVSWRKLFMDNFRKIDHLF